jgi:fatty-acyl-CoA synthase
LASCDPKILFFPAELAEMAGEAARQQGRGAGVGRISSRVSRPLPPAQAHTDDIAYLQYSAAARRASRMASR